MSLRELPEMAKVRFCDFISARISDWRQKISLGCRRQRLACGAQHKSWRILADSHQIGDRALGIGFGRFPQQPAETLLHHVALIIEKQSRQAGDFREEHFSPGTPNQGYACGSSMPAMVRLRPCEDIFHA